MKKAALVAGCLLITAVLHGETGSYEVKQTFLSPNGSLTTVVAAEASALGRGHPPIYSLGALSNGSFLPFRDLPPSRYFPEYHGTSWFHGIEPRWIDDRFLIFEDKAGVAIADVQNGLMLVNHVFMAYEKSPVADKWAAIRLRGTGRHQESLDANFQDTVLIIDPNDVANQIGNATEENFVGQMVAVNPGGIVLAKPQWAPDGSAFAVLTWKQGIVAAVRYDTTLRETARSTVKIQINRDAALSTGLNEDLAPVAARILSDPSTFH
jgi:hypothetical protein